MTFANIPGNFLSHSFRIGVVTVAAHYGVLDHLIPTMGSFSSNANADHFETGTERARYISPDREIG